MNNSKQNETMSKLSNNETTFWEEIATSRWGSYITEIEKRIILKAHHSTNRVSTALEIGCEGGRWSKLLSDLGWNMICTDVNQRWLDVCKNRIPTARCILVNPKDSTIPWDTESIGLLLCIEVSQVIQSGWFPRETFRVLHNGGLVVGVFWNVRSFRGLFAHITFSFKKEGLDYYKLSYPAWKREFCKKGFRILYEEGLCWFPFRRASNSALVPVITQIERSLRLHKFITLSPWVVFIAQKI